MAELVATLTTFSRVAGRSKTAFRLIQLLKVRFPDAANKFSSVAIADGTLKVIYTPALSEDVEDTIDLVDNYSQFAEGYRIGIEEPGRSTAMRNWRRR